MGSHLSYDDLEEIENGLTPDGLKKGFFIVLTTLIGFRLVSFFAMNAHQ